MHINIQKLLTGTSLVLCSINGYTANQELQDFFFDACVNPTGLLATRCAETAGSLGDLSSDSESSLNPSQSLSSTDSALASAQRRGQEVSERLDRNSTEVVGTERLSVGPFNLLINARHTSTEMDRVVDLQEERGYQLDQESAALGGDYRVNDALTVGGWVQWESTSLEFDREAQGANFTPIADAGSIDSDGLGLTLYLSTQLSKKAYLDASIGYNRSSYDFERNSVFQEFTRTITQTNVLVKAEADGEEISATLNWGYAADFNAWNVTPFVGATYVDSRVDAYLERDLSGSGLALAVAEKDQSTLVGHMGVSINRAISMQGWVLIPQARLQYVRELDTERSEASAQFLNDANANRLNLKGDNPDDDRVDFAVGLVAILPNGWIPFIEYQLTTATDDLDRYQIAAGLRVEL